MTRFLAFKLGWWLQGRGWEKQGRLYRLGCWLTDWSDQ